MLDKGIHALRDDRKDHPFVRLNGQAGRWRMTGLTKVVEIPIVISFDDASVRPPVSPLPDRLPGRWPLRLNSDWRGYQPDFGDHWSGDGDAIPGGRDGPGCQGGIGIGAYTVLVFSPDRS
ncbi:hypothetical protein [Geminicoccus roseus]|uniref:hypothetical protein n=1 Tax=Geminicoccus roseus TaxID=404900 RepID=UPI000419129F|nr:hypothetical protein [Geminicoccus roseus]